MSLILSDTDQYAECIVEDSDQQLPVTTSWSIAMWLYLDSRTGEVFTMSTTDNITTRMLLHFEHGYLVFEASGFPSGVYNTAWDEDVIDIDSWQHVVLVFDINEVGFLLYINGELQTASASSGWTADSIYPQERIVFGRAVGGLTAFSGKIEELAMFGEALNTKHVEAMYEDKLSVACSPWSFLCGWRFINETPVELHKGDEVTLFGATIDNSSSPGNMLLDPVTYTLAFLIRKIKEHQGLSQLLATGNIIDRTNKVAPQKRHRLHADRVELDIQVSGIDFNRRFTSDHAKLEVAYSFNLKGRDKSYRRLLMPVLWELFKLVNSQKDGLWYQSNPFISQLFVANEELELDEDIGAARAATIQATLMVPKVGLTMRGEY